MIYFFNSGYYNEYTVNVLNILHLPYGVENVLKYSSTPQHCYIEEHLKSMRTYDQKVLIVFIDRNDINGFKFYPLRIGTLTNIEKNESKYIFTVKLGEYYTVDDIDLFNSVLQQNFPNKVPKLGCTEDRTKDGTGFFAFEGEDITPFFTNMENPWTAIVNRLSKLDVFKNRVSFFTKLEFIDLSGKEIKTKKIKSTRRICLRKNETYKLNLSYYYDAFINESDRQIEVGLAEKERNFTVIKKIQQVGNKQGKFDYEISIKTNPEQKFEGLLFHMKNSLPDRTDLFTTSPTPVAFVDDKKMWLQLAIISLLIGVCNWLMDINAQEILSDLSKKGRDLECYEQVLFNISKLQIQHPHLYPAALNIAISILTLLMFWKFGRSIEK